MLRLSFLFLMTILLAACRYESTADLRTSTRNYKVTGAFPEGRHLFQTKDQSELLRLTVMGDKAHLVTQKGGGSEFSATVVTILASETFPGNNYVAMAVSSDKKGPRYHYYPFNFNQSHVEWMRPTSTVEIFGLTDLAQHIATAQQAKTGVHFYMVPEDQRAAVEARFKAWRESVKAKAQAGTGAAPAPLASAPAVAAKPQVRGFTIGDGVYVRGVFSDQAGVIQDIDAANGRVKVLNYDDGISDWVSADRIISRGQSTANDVGRGVLAIGAVVCIMNPEACKPKPK